MNLWIPILLIVFLIVIGRMIVYYFKSVKKDRYKDEGLDYLSSPIDVAVSNENNLTNITELV